MISFFTSRPLPQSGTPDGFDSRGLTISDRLNWGKIEVVTDTRTCKLWRIPVFMPEGHKYADPEVQRKARSISGPFPDESEGGR
eukprot:9089070-Alexandrium_andersonii.AAC.1